MSLQNGQVTNHDHTKARYSFHKVCRIFNCSRDTLKDRLRRGFPRPDGSRIKLRYIQLGRAMEFEVDEVERVYRQLSSDTFGDVLQFDEDEESRGARRERIQERRTNSSRSARARGGPDADPESDAA